MYVQHAHMMHREIDNRVIIVTLYSCYYITAYLYYERNVRFDKVKKCRKTMDTYFHYSLMLLLEFIALYLHMYMFL